MRHLSLVLRKLTDKSRCLLRAPRRCFGQPASQTHPHMVQEGEVTPGLTREEFYQRRSNLMELIARDRARTAPDASPEATIVIIPGAAKAYMTHDIPYPFRQNTDILYLCGFLEPDSLLVLEGKSSPSQNHTSTLFVPKKDRTRELWDGPRSGVSGTLELTGVDSAYNVEEFGHFLTSYLKEYGTSRCNAWYDRKDPVHQDYHQKYMVPFMKDSRIALMRSPQALIQALRIIKSPAERSLMQKSCSIASKAFVEVMKMSYPGVNEAHLYAKMDFECRINGAPMLAYPPVVAGGSRANTIHYISNNQLVAGGELVLMDAGCEFGGYSSDITRTWPVSGEFSDPQRVLYEALLEVQEYCISLCSQANVTMETIFLEMLTAIGKHLQTLGIIDPGVAGVKLQQKAREFCPHHVSHYLGMDVHDTDQISRGTALLPGMCITIEPGIYIAESNHEVPKEFRGIGMRIEDDILIAESKCVNLTAQCPKHPSDIERIMKDR